MKNKKVFIILFAFFVILLITLIVVLNYLKKQEVVMNESAENEKILQEAVEDYSSDKIFPRGMATLGAYKGENSKNDLYRGLQVLVDYLPLLSSNIERISSDDLQGYFAENKSEIIEKLGISEVDDFIEFAQYIQDLSLSNGKYSSCEIDTSTYKNLGSYFTFNLNIEFVVNQTKKDMDIKVYFADIKSIKPQIKYGLID